MQTSAEAEILMASRPIVRTALRTNSTSTSEAYLVRAYSVRRQLWLRKKQNRAAEIDRRISLFQFCENLFDVPLVRQPVDDLEFSELDVDRIVVLAEEDLDVVPEYRGSPLNDQVDVAQGDVLNLVARRQQSHWSTQRREFRQLRSDMSSLDV